MQPTNFFLWAMAFATTCAQQFHSPVLAQDPCISSAKNNLTTRNNATVSSNATTFGNSTKIGNSTAPRNSTTLRNSTTCGDKSRGSGFGSGKGSDKGSDTGTGGNGKDGGGSRSTDPPSLAAGYALRAADAGGLVTIAALGVAFTLLM
ncbi:hypothetical protein PGQ11_003730 [Apiospora arundinis]|uniref:Uncharacterized protein n=1 Tax=Apiospora arundinis TaxID=335852 RepID=A0ABR2J6C0_9PEZI